MEAKISISDPKSLKEAIIDRCQQLDMENMAKDVEPFLFDPSDIKKLSDLKMSFSSMNFKMKPFHR